MRNSFGKLLRQNSFIRAMKQPTTSMQPLVIYVACRSSIFSHFNFNFKVLFTIHIKMICKFAQQLSDYNSLEFSTYSVRVCVLLSFSSSRRNLMWNFRWITMIMRCIFEHATIVFSSCAAHIIFRVYFDSIWCQWTSNILPKKWCRWFFV